jgi:hypothetical protein
MSAGSLLELFEQRIAALEQSVRPELERELADMHEARATAAELVDVVRECLDMPLLPAALEERAARALSRACELISNKGGDRYLWGRRRGCVDFHPLSRAGERQWINSKIKAALRKRWARPSAKYCKVVRPAAMGRFVQPNRPVRMRKSPG